MYRYTIKIKENEELFLENEEAKAFACTEILKNLNERKVLAFVGEMGAGKTTFIKQLCKDLGSKDVVNSPTFAIVNVYDYMDERVKKNIYHFDCYRIKSIQEAIDFGAEEYLYSGDYCFIEWPEKIEELLPEDIVRIEIKVNEDYSRVLTIK